MKTTCPPAENVYLMKPPSLLSVVTLLWGLFSGLSGSPHPHPHLHKKQHFYIEIPICQFDLETVNEGLPHSMANCF